MTTFRATPCVEEHTLITLKQAGPDVLVYASKELPDKSIVKAKVIRICHDGIIYRCKFPDKATAIALGIEVTNDLYIRLN